MANVWVLECCCVGDADMLLGVFSTQQLAQAAAAKTKMSAAETHITEWKLDVGEVCAE